MLGTATYAWFTMSREVEVKNIQMTATVPEDIQISIGEIASHSDAYNLAKGTGYLSVTGSGSAATAKEPSADYDWSNTVDISAYYTFGKLIPASSVNGANVFFTPDANGVGKTVDPTGTFYVAASGATATLESGWGSGAGSNTAKATAHAFTAEHTDSWATGSGTSDYKKSVGWNNTNDDGYYIDIPVWLRTSSTEGINLGVKAYVKDVAAADAINMQSTANSGAETTNEMLYRAVRVAILDGDGTQITGINPLDVQDGDSGSSPYEGGSIVNYYERSAKTSGTGQTNANNKQAVASAGRADAVTYGTVTPETGTTTIATLRSTTAGDYGVATKLIIRVWLEGEDPDCWNETAGQDWSINLKFFKK
jgi:hypothetical protein